MNDDLNRRTEAALEAARSGNIILVGPESRHKLDAVQPLADLGLVDLWRVPFETLTDRYAFRLA